MAKDWDNDMPAVGKSPLLVLEELARNEQPIRVEIEGVPLRFISRLSLRHGVVLIHKPAEMQADPVAGGHARIGLPHDPKRELRMEVLVPHLVLADGSAAFLCHDPVSLHSGRRNAARHRLAQDAGLRLHVGDADYALADLSMLGCRVVLVGGDAQTRFPLDQGLGTASLQAGSLVRVELHLVIPRMQRDRFIGCEFRPGRDGRSEQALRELLATLERVSDRRQAVS